MKGRQTYKRLQPTARWHSSDHLTGDDAGMPALPRVGISDATAGPLIPKTVESIYDDTEGTKTG